MKFSSNQLITALFVTSMIVGSCINAQAHDRSEKHINMMINMITDTKIDTMMTTMRLSM
jgi:chemotaxis receptor (MCP) glutamine deamidase CheD